jgi:hypothetical protein
VKRWASPARSLASGIASSSRTPKEQAPGPSKTMRQTEARLPQVANRFSRNPGPTILPEESATDGSSTPPRHQGARRWIRLRPRPLSRRRRSAELRPRQASAAPYAGPRSSSPRVAARPPSQETPAHAALSGPSVRESDRAGSRALETVRAPSCRERRDDPLLFPRFSDLQFPLGSLLPLV